MCELCSNWWSKKKTKPSSCVNTFIVTVHVGKKGILASILRQLCISFPFPAHILLICFFSDMKGAVLFFPIFISHVLLCQHSTCILPPWQKNKNKTKLRGIQACIPTPLYDPAISHGLHPRKCSLFDPSVYKQMNQRRNWWEDRMKATG